MQVNDIDLNRKYSEMSYIGYVIKDISTISQTESLPYLHSHSNLQNFFVQVNHNILNYQIFNSNGYK